MKARPRSVQRTLLLSIAAVAGLIGWLVARPSGQAPSDARPRLHVLAYPSFLASWGAGPKLAKDFETRENCKVEFIQADDAGQLLAKLAAFPADVVVGFDQFSLAGARSKGGWLDHGVTLAPGLGGASGSAFGSDRSFLAYDWAELGFVYRDGEVAAPASIDDLLAPAFLGSLALQDPRSSTPGFQFLAWLVRQKSELTALEILRRLQPNVHSYASSWSQAYGLLTKGLAKMAYSYSTSPLYHRQMEEDDRYRFASLGDRPPVQVEYAAIAEKSVSPSLARKFMAYLVSVEAQKIIMTGNWMLPVVRAAAEGSDFLQLWREPDTTQLQSVSAADRDRWLKIWAEGRK